MEYVMECSYYCVLCSYLSIFRITSTSYSTICLKSKPLICRKAVTMFSFVVFNIFHSCTEASLSIFWSTWNTVLFKYWRLFLVLIFSESNFGCWRTPLYFFVGLYLGNYRKSDYERYWIFQEGYCTLFRMYYANSVFWLRVMWRDASILRRVFFRSDDWGVDAWWNYYG